MGRHLDRDGDGVADYAEQEAADLLAAVRGRGPVREPDETARAEAEALDDWPDLRGRRDFEDDEA